MTASQPGTGKVAVIVAHGMGQQIPFETLDSVATGLVDAAGRRGDREARRYQVERVSLGGQRLARVKLEFRMSEGVTRVAHLYEAYWAPLTEGEIGLGGVTAFLWRAGLNGVSNWIRPFTRRLFGDSESFEPPIRSLIFILVALAVVAALGVMNAAIAAVAAAHAFYTTPSGWLTTAPAQGPVYSVWLGDALLRDLTSVFSAVLAGMGVFVVALLLNRVGGALGRTFGFITVLVFAGLVVLIVLAGVAIPSIVLRHARAPGGAIVAGALGRTLPEWIALGLSVVLVTAFVAVIVYLIATIVFGTWREWRTDRAWFSSVVALLFCLLLGAVLAEVTYLARSTPEAGGGAEPWVFQRLLTVAAGPAIIWLALVAASALVRLLLVQYPGDVAIYVQPHMLDRYYEVREGIKKLVSDIARGVYAAKDAAGGGFEYDEVMVVGHSLGSVVAYDSLNRLLWEDAVAPQSDRLDVAGRTKLLLTFGSPLDKTAFIFTMQRKRHSSELREVLATSVQPIIEDARFRTFRWINIYSHWDIISGRLDFYDRRDRSNPNPVDNYVDPDASTFLLAHVEYWRNPLLSDTLHGEIAGWPRPRPGGTVSAFRK